MSLSPTTDFLRAVRRRRFAILGAAILAVTTAAPVGIAGNDDPGADPVPVASTRQRTETIVLAGRVEALPATPLMGLTQKAVVQWLVKDGAVVKEGEVLYRELKPGVPQDLDELRSREQKAVQDLKDAQAAPPDYRPEEAAIAQATQVHSDAVRSLEVAEAEGAGAIRSAEAAVVQALTFGDHAQVAMASTSLHQVKLRHTSRVNALREAVDQAALQMDNANAALAWKQFEERRRIIELQRAPGELAAQIRRAELSIAQGVAVHDGVIRIHSRRVPDGSQAAELVVGEIRPPGLVMVAAVGVARSRLPDLMAGASARIGDSELPCDGAELAAAPDSGEPSGLLVRCPLPAHPGVSVGTTGELRLVSGGG